ncbi:uncharacterized protein LOC118753604 [Rhagoletis pomonella]|uniref:uncharacterized protein LOC118753604 n=1 Tax=Rhagoletis pomonella TaxID=28610 RepID=UPI001781FD83|nr:uncharacterized protein LOC118753604 [Rhagoletis pomonella]
MRQNRTLACGQFSGPDSSKRTKEKWEEVAADLNAIGGANKSAEQWKRCWIDWKASIKQKFSAIKRFQNQTGNLPSCLGPEPLDSLEEEVVNFILVSDVVDGDAKTVEGGFDIPLPALDDDILCMEKEYLNQDVIEVSVSKTTCSKNKSPINTPRRKIAKNSKQSKEPLYSELEKAKKELEARLSSQERCMNEVKEELK